MIVYAMNCRSAVVVVDTTNSKRLHPAKIGIFIATDNHSSEVFEQNIAVLTCYARRHSYHIIPTNIERYLACSQISQSIYYQRHCLALMFLLEHMYIEWLVVLDIDTLVMNMSKRIESYLSDVNNQAFIHLILYEKFNGEIATGNYIIRNHPWSHAFLSLWFQSERQTMNFTFHNHDAGTLYLQLLGSMVGKVKKSAYERCLRIYEQTNNHSMYHTYVGCCKCALGGRWEFDHVRILRRGHGFIRETIHADSTKRIWSSTDFLIHNHGENISMYYSNKIDVQQCIKYEYILPIREEFIIKGDRMVKEIIKKYDQQAARAYPQSVGLPEIGSCWPNCTNTKARQQAFVEEICRWNAG